MAETGSVERKEDFDTSVGYWLEEIKSYDKTFKPWQDRADIAVRRYRADLETSPTGFSQVNRFNIFWSNVQTLQPALYSRLPKPDITRAHKDKNPVARAAAFILERSTRDQIDKGGFDSMMRAVRDDYLLTARGQGWKRYVPTYGEETRDRTFLQADTAEDGTTRYMQEDGSPYEAAPQFTKEGQAYFESGEPYRPVVAECVKQDHIAWKDFGHTPAPKWEKVRAVWKREMLARDQLIKRFGEKKGKAVSLTKAVPNVSADAAETYGDAFKRGEVYEIWDRTSGKVIWISPGYTEGVLDEKDDPLKLEGDRKST